MGMGDERNVFVRGFPGRPDWVQCEKATPIPRSKEATGAAKGGDGGDFGDGMVGINDGEIGGVGRDFAAAGVNDDDTLR